MKQLVLFLLAVHFVIDINAQEHLWFAYPNSDTTLYGYKDAKGAVKVAPIFMVSAARFENVVSVVEGSDSKYASYYINRHGRKFGIDSLYFFDNAPDCESEGFIRFRNRKTDKVGMFNKNGNVAIPAIYSYLDKVKNGLVEGLVGATKKQDGEHYFLEGGTSVLLDSAGKILINDFGDSRHLNFYSLKISDQPDSDPDRTNYRGVNGECYSFVDYEKEFKNWLNHLTQNFTSDLLKKNIFEEVTFANDNSDWTQVPGNQFVERNFGPLQKALLQIRQSTCDSFIASNGLNPFIFESPLYTKYFNNCNEAMEWKYPVMQLIISHKDEKGGISGQDHFDFLRTSTGYKLISAQIQGVDFR